MSGTAAEPLRIECDKQASPLVWVSEILNKASGRSVEKVQQLLIGATLARRYPDRDIADFCGQATNLQPEMDGGLALGTVTYHVAGKACKEVIARCKEDLGTGVLPVILVPHEQVAIAMWRAESDGVSNQVSIFAIEEFITQNIIELSTDSGEDLFTALQRIVSEYNRRLQEVETDMSLKIEIR